MTNEIIERVAKALIKAHLQPGIMTFIDFNMLARCAIEAMREPTEEMINKAENTPIGHAWGSEGEFLVGADAIWRAMIDKALEE